MEKRVPLWRPIVLTICLIITIVIVIIQPSGRSIVAAVLTGVLVLLTWYRYVNPKPIVVGGIPII